MKIKMKLSYLSFPRQFKQSQELLFTEKTEYSERKRHRINIELKSQKVAIYSNVLGNSTGRIFV